MKLFSVKVTQKKTQTVLLDIQERSITKKSLQSKYRLKYRFDEEPVKIIIERLRKKPGVQVNLLDMIEEIEQTKLDLTA